MLAVKLPLALPAIIAGLRITTVSTIALLTVGGVIQQGGLGQLLYDGFQEGRNAQILAGLVLIVLLGLVADLLLLLFQRWSHRGSGRPYEPLRRCHQLADRPGQLSGRLRADPPGLAPSAGCRPLAAHRPGDRAADRHRVRPLAPRRTVRQPARDRHACRPDPGAAVHPVQRPQLRGLDQDGGRLPDALRHSTDPDECLGRRLVSRARGGRGRARIGHEPAPDPHRASSCRSQCR